MHLLSSMGTIMCFGKYVCVLSCVLSMRVCGTLSRLDGLDLKNPRPNGIRPLLIWSMLISKLLKQFSMMCLLTNFIDISCEDHLRSMENPWDYLWGNKEGQVHEIANSHYLIQGSEDEWGRVIWFKSLVNFTRISTLRLV